MWRKGGAKQAKMANLKLFSINKYLVASEMWEKVPIVAQVGQAAITFPLVSVTGRCPKTTRNRTRLIVPEVAAPPPLKNIACYPSFLNHC